MSNDNDLQIEVTNLVYREAMLLDRRRWDDWIDLYTEDAMYWVPAWANEEDTTNDPDTQRHLIYLRNRRRLEDRVFRIETRDSYASYPLDRTVHVVSNVLIEKTDGDTVEATANCVVHSYGKKGSLTRGGMYDFTLTRINGELKISRKKIVFIDDRLEGPIDVYHL